MKVTKSQLRQLIEEELEQELQELYIPFIGGKLPGEEVFLRRKQLEAIIDTAESLNTEEKEEFMAQWDRHPAIASEEEAGWRIGDRIEAGQLGQLFQQLRGLMYKRHPKDKAQSLMDRFDRQADKVSKSLGGLAQELADQKAEAAAEKEKARARRYEREQEEEERRKYARETERNRQRQQRWKDEDRRKEKASWSPGRSYTSASDPAKTSAGRRNLGYGESLDRGTKMKVTKAQLKEIIQQELQTLMREKAEEEDPYERPLEAPLAEAEGKGCAESEGGSGCIKKRGDQWVILNNKKGGVWRKCDSEAHCEEILDAFHASRG